MHIDAHVETRLGTAQPEKKDEDENYLHLPLHSRIARACNIIWKYLVNGRVGNDKSGTMSSTVKGEPTQIRIIT